MNLKVVVIADAFLYHLSEYYGQDFVIIFKVRVDFHIFMEKIDKSIYQFSVFIKDLSF